MSFGLGLGLLVAIAVYLRAPVAPTTPAAVAAALQAVAAISTQTASMAEPASDGERAAPADAGGAGGRAAQGRTEQLPRAVAESRFSFYEILPEFEVVVRGDDEPAAAPAARRAPPAETPGSFLLQAGSFSAAGDADRLQANLALLGFESHVQRVTIDDGVFNRVRIGPIGDLDSAKRTQRRLRDAGIDTLLMQVPN